LLAEATTPSNRRTFWLCVTVWSLIAVIEVDSKDEATS
jgi:hypothetical protein